MKYTVDTKVEFYAGLGYVRGNREEIKTLGELGLEQEEIDEMSENDIEDFLSEMYDQWLSNYLNCGWSIKE